MLAVIRVLMRALELLLLLPFRILRVVLDRIAFNPRLGPLRYVASAATVYILFALALVYVVAPLRALVGHYTLGEKLHYDAERWLATAIYDARGNFVGTFDPRLDSLRDINYTAEAIDVGDYTANPDHKSIPVREVPEQYWQCLVYLEDRNLGGPLNPFGIDLAGVLKIPLSTLRRSILARHPVLGIGGSTLAMQFVRVIYQTPPHADEGALTKLKRKFGEWWLAPVIYRELTLGGDTKLKQWAADHLWLAQRTGGSPLHGIEVTSRIVFGKEAKDLTVAEQFVLASAVNRPIILLQGSERLNEVRLDRWRYLTEVRARSCAQKLITDEAQQKQVVFDLIAMAGGPPDPKIKPKLQQALDRYEPALAQRAQANPVIRANALMQGARYGVREEMKQVYGFGWRDHVRGVTTTFEAGENLAFGRKEEARLAELDTQFAGKIDAGYTLDPAKVSHERKSPNVIVVAANAEGEIVRYYEQGETASYFGSPFARDPATGFYELEPRKPHGCLHRQDPSGHRHRQHHARYRADALPRHAGAGEGAGGLRPWQRAAWTQGDRDVRLLAQRSAHEPHRPGRPGAHSQDHRRARLRHAPAGRYRRADAALHRGRARARCGLAAPGAPHRRRGAGEPDRPRERGHQDAVADQNV